jgi:hypothetical protein
MPFSKSAGSERPFSTRCGLHYNPGIPNKYSDLHDTYVG